MDFHDLADQIGNKGARFLFLHKIMPHCMAENKRNIADVFVEP